MSRPTKTNSTCPRYAYFRKRYLANKTEEVKPLLVERKTGRKRDVVKQREYFRNRRIECKAANQCVECRGQLGGNGGTSIRCPVCAEIHRGYSRKDSVPRPAKEAKPNESVRIGKMLALSERLTVLDRLRTT